MTRDEITTLGRRILAESTAAKRDAREDVLDWGARQALDEIDAQYNAAHAAQLLAARLVLLSEREAEIARPLLGSFDHISGTRDDRVARWAALEQRFEAVLPLVEADALAGVTW